MRSHGGPVGYQKQFGRSVCFLLFSVIIKSSRKKKIISNFGIFAFTFIKFIRKTVAEMLRSHFCVYCRIFIFNLKKNQDFFQLLKFRFFFYQYLTSEERVISRNYFAPTDSLSLFDLYSTYLWIWRGKGQPGAHPPFSIAFRPKIFRRLCLGQFVYYSLL